MSIPNFSISQTQWDVLDLFDHPMKAAGALQAHCRLTAGSATGESVNGFEPP